MSSSIGTISKAAAMSSSSFVDRMIAAALDIVPILELII
jgi:hypothetical protein